MVNSERKRLAENDSIPRSKPQNMVKIGALPFKMVPNETVKMFKAIFEKPISNAVDIPIGKTYSLNCLLVNGSGLHAGLRDTRKAQTVVMVFEKVVTVSGFAK